MKQEDRDRLEAQGATIGMIKDACYRYMVAHGVAADMAQLHANNGLDRIFDELDGFIEEAGSKPAEIEGQEALHIAD